MKTRLKQARRSCGMNQKDAAVELGVSIGTYRNWEQGRVIMNGEQLIKAAALYNTSVDFILMTEPDDEHEDELDELSDLYMSINDTGREALMAVAEAFAERFPKE